MITPARIELENFSQFVAECLRDTGPCPRPEEVLDLWRTQNPPEDSILETVAAVQEAVESINAGEPGKPAREFVADFRREVAERRKR